MSAGFPLMALNNFAFLAALVPTLCNPEQYLQQKDLLSEHKCLYLPTCFLHCSLKMHAYLLLGLFLIVLLYCPVKQLKYARVINKRKQIFFIFFLSQPAGNMHTATGCS